MELEMTMMSKLVDGTHTWLSIAVISASLYADSRDQWSNALSLKGLIYPSNIDPYFQKREWITAAALLLGWWDGVVNEWVEKCI